MPANRAFATDLHGAYVSIRYIQRASTKFDTNDHVAFWEEWINSNGGRVADVEKVQGAG